MVTKHKWVFRTRLRKGAFSWKSSRLACERLNEAVTEISLVARVDPVMAGDGVVSLAERIWPALEPIDTSSGAVGSAVYGALEKLLPIVQTAPADRKTRDKWLERLWQAICDDGVSYLSPVEERWGELCGSAEVASRWADKLLPVVREAWSDQKRYTYVQCTFVCLSSLLAAGRHEELLDLLALERHPSWHDRRYGVKALLAQGRTADALDYAEASRGLNNPDRSIDAMCEQILLDAGRVDEAYDRYALTANQANTGVATFRLIVKKYPQRDRKRILLDLAEASGDKGKWFAAAKSVGYLDLALEFAKSGNTDPRTLSRAARDLLDKDAVFSLRVGRLAVERILGGFGYEITYGDVIEACDRFLAAGRVLGVTADARDDLARMAAECAPEVAVFRDSLLRHARSAAAAGV
jgi:hypothetical protein